MKYHLFHPDSPLIQFLSRIGRLIILNLIFLITCIPIFTIGAAWTSLYSVTLKQARNEEPYIVKKYFSSFKENFKQSTLLWLIWLPILLLLGIDYQVMRHQTSFIASIMRIALILVIILAYMTISYVFPLQASFYNSIKQTMQNAFLLSIRHINYTIPIILIPIAALCLTLISTFALYYGILFWFFMGFAMMAQLKSHYFIKIIDYHLENPEEFDYSSYTDSQSSDSSSSSLEIEENAED